MASKKQIKMEKFGEFLTGRQPGQEAYDALLHALRSDVPDCFQLSFRHIKMVNTVFANAAIGQLAYDVHEQKGELNLSAYQPLLLVGEPENEAVRSVLQYLTERYDGIEFCETLPALTGKQEAPAESKDS